jgi:hypothetical protein
LGMSGFSCWARHVVDRNPRIAMRIHLKIICLMAKSLIVSDDFNY